MITGGPWLDAFIYTLIGIIIGLAFNTIQLWRAKEKIKRLIISFNKLSAIEEQVLQIKQTIAERSVHLTTKDFDILVQAVYALKQLDRMGEIDHNVFQGARRIIQDANKVILENISRSKLA